MKPKVQISIPKPCHENWNAMTPESKGRFCALCSKTVIDFTEMKDEEITDYFQENGSQKVCGRFRNNQLHPTSVFEIPQSVLCQKRNFYHAFMLTLFVVMGTSLFSCKDHQDNTIGEVTVVEDVKEQTLVGDTVYTETVEDSLLNHNRNIKITSEGLKLPKSQSKEFKTLGFTVSKIVEDTIKGQ